MATYVNPWHSKRDKIYGPANYETDVKPVEYKGFLIYERIRGVVWDVVKNGRAVGQFAGPNGARGFINQLAGVNS